MNRAMFIGLSAVFFISYSLIANALGVGGDSLNPITAPQSGDFVDEQCDGNSVCDVPILGGIVKFVLGAGEAISDASNIFVGFFQLITFQAPGMESASIVTLVIFVPLAFINAFIIFTAIRGTS